MSMPGMAEERRKRLTRWWPLGVILVLALAGLIVSNCGGGQKSVDVPVGVAPSSPLGDSPVSSPAPTPVPLPPPEQAPPPTAAVVPIYGVTIDDISGLPDIVDALRRLSRRPTARIVFDETVQPAYYRDAVVAVAGVGQVMGEILDSQFVNTVTVSGYLTRTSDYLAALGDVVDIWEVGNEINGEWLGATADVVAKMTGAFDLVRAAGKTTALTLYYNQDCWSNPANEMFRWTQANVPDRMKQGLDYVLISYYEDDCNGLQPDWPVVFAQLASIFPNSRIGFGEVGTSDPAKKAAYVTRYYSMTINEPRYVGGYFWWYFRQDMVPWTQPLWGTLDSTISTR